MKRQRLGQHYLVDEDVVRRMIAEAGIRAEERVLEVGTGKGALTVELAEVSSRLEGYEIDPSNFRDTAARVSGGNVTIRMGDAFNSKRKFDVIVSSLPYSVSAKFVGWLSQTRYRRGVVLLQKDFVEKVTSEPGSRDYRAVSAIAQMSTEFKLLAVVPRAAFDPPPKVDSVMVSVAPRKLMSAEQVAWVRKLFSLRRQQVSSALSKLGMKAPGASFGERRVFSLAPDELWRLVE
ncbi:MAG: hypothetical protein HY296_08125 [Thaumarchaeota archaeon]|nr:hypothetical protein [Nitrososphaerota archaeon]